MAEISFDDLVPARAGGDISFDDLIPAKEPRKPRFEGQNDALDTVMQGLSLGFSDEIGAFARSLVSGKSYKDELSAERESLKRYKDENPITATALEIGGAALLPGGSLLRGGSIAARMGRGAAVGGATGAAYGAGTGETMQERGERAVSGGLFGAGAGALLGPLAGGGSRTPSLAGTTATGQEAVEAAGRLGLEQFPRIAATESIPSKRIGLTVSKVPWGGTPVQEAIEQSSQEVGRRVAKVAEGFGGGSIASRPEAGSAVSQGLKNYIGPVTKKRVSDAYNSVDRLVNKNVQSPLTATMRVANDIVSERGEAALRGTGTAVDTVLDAATRPSGLTYEGIKKLRSSIGEMLDQGILPANTSQSELKRIYGALSDDLKGSVSASGGQPALQAFERANKLNSLVSARREELAKMLGSKSDETLFDSIQRMAGSKGGANIELLAKARKALPPDEWNEVASAVVSRLGQANKGNIETFSPTKFLTEYRTLTDAGKSILFGSTGKTELRKSLDDIVKVSERLSDLGQYANPSGTAQMGIGTAFGAFGFAEAAMTGGLPLTTMAGLLGTRFVASALSKPATARSMANWSMAYELAIRKPGQGTFEVLKAASRKFAADAGEALGLRAHVNQIATALQGSIPTQAEGEQQ